MTHFALPGALLLAVIVAFVVRAGADTPSLNQAASLLAALEPGQRLKLVLPFESESRTAWAYTPGSRPGVVLKELSSKGKQAALDLLKASLSEAGFAKAKSIQNEVEIALREIEGNPRRDSELYYVAFFGTPTAKGVWGWRFEGHHLSFHFTYRDGKMVSSTPQFLGSNPAEIRQGPNKGMRVLALEEDLGRELAKSLDAEQSKAAILSDRAPADIATSNQRNAAHLEDNGLGFDRMTDAQKRLLRDLVDVYANVQRPEQAKARLAKIEKGGWNKVKFAWMGGLEPGQGHYYRIQGPSFLIEYDNTQDRANHIHSVWRDFEGDFGRDTLAEHYRKSPHH